jgi:hypothetical protein
MKQTISLTVSRPCSEKFKAFKQTKSGGFCNFCSKNVIDFRKMSDEQVAKHFKNKTGKTCGYFDISQLNKTIEFPELKKNTSKFNFLRVAAFATLSLTSLHTMQAQEQKPSIEVLEPSIKSNNESKEKPQEQLLAGTILDKEYPLPGANIILKGTTIGTSTNFDGKFIFPKVLKEGDVLVISYLGYATQEIKIRKEQTILNAMLDINMQEDMSCVLMGEVDVDKVYKSKPSLWKRIKSIF